jgi:hypothetical protein
VEDPARVNTSALGSHAARRRARLAALVVLLLAGLAVLPSAALARNGQNNPGPRVPQGFVGVNIDGPMVVPGTPINLGRQLNTMVASGVETVRIAFSWATAQPYPSFALVPPGSNQFTDVGGVPTDFTATDAIVGQAARRGMSVLPTIVYAPLWDATPNPNGVETPTSPGPYAAYCAALVHRYGPNGSFWSQNPGIPKVPVRMWQIWNEPNLAYYWSQPFAKSFVGLLRPAHNAIKQADPGAKVVLGALTNLAWVAIGQLGHAGADNLYDVASVNGFTKYVANVVVYLRLVRQAMDRTGVGRKPLLATEISWPSAKGQRTQQQFDWDVTQSGQAHNIAQLLPLLRSARKSLKLAGFDYYTWMGDESPPHSLAFDFAGLVKDVNGTVFTKPALGAFRTAALALENCARKSSLATKCARSAS